MEKHYGQILEYTVRKCGYNLSKMANQLHVTRRTLYNWFQSPLLKSDVIYRIGLLIRHDFSVNFPELFTTAQFSFQPKDSMQNEIYNDEKWKKKYIDLLKDYSKLLKQQIDANQRSLDLSMKIP